MISTNNIHKINLIVLDNQRIEVREITEYQKNLFVIKILTEHLNMHRNLYVPQRHNYTIWIKTTIDLTYFCDPINRN